MRNFVMLKWVFLLVFLFVNNLLFSQKKIDTSYTYIPYYGIVGKDAPPGYLNEKNTNGFYWGSSFDYAVFEFTNIFKSELSNKREQLKEQQRLEKVKQQSLAKLTIIKNQYSEHSTFPKIIIDGWHKAIATDNVNFCKEVKVEVKDNKIIKLIVENYIPLDFMSTGEIRNGKNVVTLNNFNNEQFNIIELYFLYDLDSPQLVPEPIKPGYVCFWSNVKKADEIEIRLDDNLLDRITVGFKTKPGCFSKGTVCRILKPGIYYVEARGGGKGYVWKGSFEVKENMCLEYPFFKANSF